MNGLIPPPDPLGIPSHFFIFQFLYWITFVLHLIFMNYVLGGMVIVTVHEWLAEKNSLALRGNALLMRIMPVALSLAITMGVAPLLFVQVLYGNFFYTANIMMGWWWMAVIGAVTAAFYLIYLMISLRTDESRSGVLIKILSLIVTVLFLMTAWIFTNNAVLMEHPNYWKDIYSGAHRVMAPDPSLWPRFFHNVVGAIAVAGLWCAAIGRYRIRYHTEERDLGYHLVNRGLTWTMMAVIVQICVGIILVFSLGHDTNKKFMGNGPLFTGWAIGFFAAMGVLAHSMMALVKPEKPMLLWGAIGLTGVTLLGMTMGRDLLRQIYLEPYFKLQDLPLHYSNSLWLFLITFLLGLGILAYLIRLVWNLPKKVSQEVK